MAKPAQNSNQKSISAFTELDLPTPLKKALDVMGFKNPTPVQSQAIPLALEGRDILASAQTGTGKTAAFAIPLLMAMMNGSKKPALILAPTRELAEQISRAIEQLTQYAPQLKTSVVIGGSSYSNQIRSLRANPMFVVGTPGRLIDQIELGNLQMDNFGYLVIDEADRLLDMGFEPQLEQILMSFPKHRQTLLFSATLPKEILKLASRYQTSPARVSIGETTTPVEKIKQQVIMTSGSAKSETLIREIDKVAGSLIVFTRTKTRTEAVAKVLSGAGHQVARIHGDRSQRQRSDAIAAFRTGEARILVATDIAARGIDIPHIAYVINYDLPMAPEDYIHRIGRTARAGAEGHALAFVTQEDKFLWAKIYKLMYGKYPTDMGKPESFVRGNRGAAKNAARKAGGRTDGAFGRTARGERAKQKLTFGRKSDLPQKPAFSKTAMTAASPKKSVKFSAGTQDILSAHGSKPEFAKHHASHPKRGGGPKTDGRTFGTKNNAHSSSGPKRRGGRSQSPSRFEKR